MSEGSTYKKNSLYNSHHVFLRLQEKWKKVFKIDFSNGLIIQPLNPTKLTSLVLDRFIYEASLIIKTYRLKRIDILSLDLRWCDEIQDSELIMIGTKIISKLRMIRRFNIDLSWCTKITDHGLQRLLFCTGHNLKRLSEIEINFTKCQHITKQTIKSFGNDIARHIKGLNSLALDFTHCNMADQELNNLASKICLQLNNLKKLRLSFKECYSITDKGIQSVGNRIQRHLKSLKSLSLCFSGCTQITDKSLLFMIHHIYSYLGNLQALYLDFSKCLRITNKGLVEIATGINSQASHLQSLTFDFSYCCIDASGFKEFTSQIEKHLKGLEKLMLNFSWSQISDDEKNKAKRLFSHIPEFKLT